MGPIKIHNGGNYAHVQDSNAYKLLLELKFSYIIGQFFKRNSMGPIKIHNGRNYAHVQDPNAYNFC